MKLNNHKANKPVEILDEDGRLVTEMPSRDVCAFVTGISATTLGRRLSGEVVTPINGMYFRWKEEK